MKRGESEARNRHNKGVTKNILEKRVIPPESSVFQKIVKPSKLTTLESQQPVGISSISKNVEGEKRSHKEPDLSGKAWTALNDFLGMRPQYAPESKLVTSVQDRLDYISDGRKAEAVVVHDETPRAFSTPGYVVVSDGLLSLLEYQEEVDALLGHEWLHLEDNHAHQQNDPNANIVERLGKKRRHEIEADFKPIEKLDAKDINPAGMIFLLAKLDAWEKEHIGKKENVLSGDVVHGSLLDRRLNLEEATWLIDVRNLSTKFTPLPFKKGDFGAYEDTTSLIERFDTLSLIEKRRVVQRECQELVEDESLSYLNKTRRAEKVVDLQKEVLLEADTTLTNQEATDLAIGIISHNYGTQQEMHQLLDDAGISFNVWLSQFDTADKIRDLFGLFKRDSLAPLGLSMKNEALRPTAKQLFTWYLQEQDHIDIPGYVQLVKSTQVVDPNSKIMINRGDGSFGTIVMNVELYYEPVMEKLQEKGAVTADNLKIFAEAVADTPVIVTPPIAHGYTYFIEPHDDGKYNELAKFVFDKRVEQIGTITNPLDLFEAITKLPDYTVWIDPPESIIHPMLRSKILQARDAFSIRDMINNLQTRYDNKINAVPDPEMLTCIANIYSNKDRARFRSKNVEITMQELSDRFLLWSRCLTPQQYLEFVDKDCKRLANVKNLSLQDIKEVAQLALDALESARALGMPVPWNLEMQDLAKVKNLRKILGEKYKTELKKKKDPALLIDMAHTIHGVSLGEKEWNTMAKKILEDPEVANTVAGLEKLLALGLVSENTQVLLQVPRKAAEAIVEKLDFSEGMAFIFEKYANLPKHLFADALAHIIEHKAKSAEDFEKVETALKGELEGFLGKDALMGEAAIIDTFVLDAYRDYEGEGDGLESAVIYKQGMQPRKLFDALLQSGASDEKLKRYLFDRWWRLYRFEAAQGEASGHFKVDTDLATYRSPGKEARLAHWSREVPNHYLPLTKMVANAYLATDPMKYALLRKTLTGEGGVLATDEGRSHFVESFVSGKVDMSSGEGAEMVTTLLRSLVEVGGQEELYQQLNPILTSMILKLPQEAYPYRDLAIEKGAAFLEKMKTGIVKNPTERDRMALQRKMYSLMIGGVAKETEVMADSTTKLLSLFPQKDTPTERPTLSPWELGITVGEKSQAAGTRILQLAGQFFPVPPEYAERVRGACDNTKGQTRLQMYRIMRREAEVAAPIAEMMENIAEIGPRIGGGSLMSVNKIFMADGSVEAVAVRNPNVEYNLGKIVDLAKRTIRYAQEIAPDNRNYQLLDVLLSDVQEWVHNELYDPDFEVKDAEFRETHDNLTSQNNHYSILIPNAKPTETRWIRREDFIEGKNLTGLQIVDSGETNIAAGVITKDDFKDVVSLLAKDAVVQLQHGLVHSDFHPGNFRITSDNTQIAIFDRYNLLRLDDADKGLVTGMVGALAQGDVRGAQAQFVNYLFELDVNQEQVGNNEEIKQALSQIENGREPENVLMDSILALKQRGVKVPLKISLIGRNLQAITQMAEQAGFNGLLGALMYGNGE